MELGSRAGQGKDHPELDYNLFHFSFDREKLTDAKNNGEQCAKLRIIELIENMVCTVDCKPPGNLEK